MGTRCDGIPKVRPGLQAVKMPQAEQRPTIPLLHTLKLLLVVMAGDDVADPYKD